MQTLRPCMSTFVCLEHAPFVRDTQKHGQLSGRCAAHLRLSGLRLYPRCRRVITKLLSPERGPRTCSEPARRFRVRGSPFMCPRYTTGLTIRADPNDRVLRGSACK